MSDKTRYPLNIPTPCPVKERRELLIHHGFCPECSGELDTGFECNRCGYDARPEAEASV